MDIEQHIKNIKGMSLKELEETRVKVARSTIWSMDRDRLNEAIDKRLDKLEAQADRLVVSCNKK